MTSRVRRGRVAPSPGLVEERRREGTVTETRRQAARKGMPDDKEPVGKQRETDGGW